MRMGSRKVLFKLVSILLVISVILSGILILTSCRGAEAPTKDVIKVGWARCLTGWGSALGQDEQKGVLLWVDMVNADGGIYVEEYGKKLPLEVVYYDDKSDPEETVRLYERLITVDKVDILLAPSTSPFNPATIPVIEKYKMPLLSATSGSTKAQELGAKYWWSVTPTGAACMDKVTGLGGLLYENRDKIKDIAIIYVHETFPVECHDAITQYLEEFGCFNVALDKDYPMGVTDLSEVLLDIKAKDVDALIGLSLPEDCFLTMGQAQEVGLNPPFIYLLLGPGFSAFPEIFGDATEGIMGMGTWCGASNYPGAKEFYDKFIEKWGHPPSLLHSVDGYHGAQIMQQAIERAGSLDPEKLREVLEGGEFTTIQGPVLLRNGVNEKAIMGVIQWQQGEAQVVWPPEWATAEFLFHKPAWP
jgi:branched-chain amino acid transport system substrate-binding protein